MNIMQQKSNIRASLEKKVPESPALEESAAEMIYFNLILYSLIS